jgi:hypothetical protein
MKLKSLVKLNALKDQPAKIEINFRNELGKEKLIDLDLLQDYLLWKDREIIDWKYYNEDEQDRIIVYVAGAW